MRAGRTGHDLPTLRPLGLARAAGCLQTALALGAGHGMAGGEKQGCQAALTGQARRALPQQLVLGINTRLLERVSAIKIARKLGLGRVCFAGDDQGDFLFDGFGVAFEQPCRCGIHRQPVHIPAVAAFAAHNRAVWLPETRDMNLASGL